MVRSYSDARGVDENEYGMGLCPSISDWFEGGSVGGLWTMVMEKCGRKVWCWMNGGKPWLWGSVGKWMWELGDRMVKVSDSDFLCFFIRWHKNSVNGDQNITTQAYESIKQKSATGGHNRTSPFNHAHRSHIFVVYFTATYLPLWCSFTRATPFSFSLWLFLFCVNLWNPLPPNSSFFFFAYVWSCPLVMAALLCSDCLPWLLPQWPPIPNFSSSSVQKPPTIPDNVWIWPYFAWQSQVKWLSLLLFLFHIYFSYFF